MCWDNYFVTGVTASILPASSFLRNCLARQPPPKSYHRPLPWSWWPSWLNDAIDGLHISKLHAQTTRRRPPSSPYLPNSPATSIPHEARPAAVQLLQWTEHIRVWYRLIPALPRGRRRQTHNRCMNAQLFRLGLPSSTSFLSLPSPAIPSSP